MQNAKCKNDRLAEPGRRSRCLNNLDSRMRNVLSSCVLILLTVAATSAQDRPDFSGTWILVSPNPAPSNAPQTLVVEASFSRQSARGTPISPPLVTLAVSPRFGNAIRSDIYTVGTIGGVVSGLPEKGLPDNGPRTSSRYSTRWDGDKLVVDLANYADGKLTSEHGEVWSLDGQGTLSITVTDHIVGDPSTTVTLVYRRQP
jgi:hypothetical protein